MIALPRIHFAHLPTRIEPLPRLSAMLGGPVIWVKRDDQTGLALGGNKARKLEFLLAEALANGAKTLVTAGALQSNHCRQVAALAARYGLDCVLVLSYPAGRVPPEASNGNLLLDGMFGARAVYCERPQREAALKSAFEEAWASGQRPYLIPLGGSNPTGTLGYLHAFDELLDQCAAQHTGFDWVVVASSSGGTQGGLAAGAARAQRGGWQGRGWNGQVLGISIDEPQSHLQDVVAGLASEALERVGERIQVAAGEVAVNAGYLGAGYGVPGESESEALRLFARLEGLLLDPVYTGRAAGALIDLARKGFFKPGERVLFWHTGGTPALFGEPYAQWVGGL